MLETCATEPRSTQPLLAEVPSPKVSPFQRCRVANSTVVVVMGVSGSGKTTVGRRLAEALGWNFADADDFHPPANVEKMRHGHPLTEEDRRPWLAMIHERIHRDLEQGRPSVITCSALRRWHRETLAAGNAGLKFVFLKADFETLHQRLAQRSGHFMGPEMLRSQLDTLEEPTEPGIWAETFDARLTVDELVQAIIARLKLAPAAPE